jgi:signal transduction histidine kinase/CheY-like chemotaxis protein
MSAPEAPLDLRSKWPVWAVTLTALAYGGWGLIETLVPGAPRLGLGHGVGLMIAAAIFPVAVLLALRPHRTARAAPGGCSGQHARPALTGSCRVDVTSDKARQTQKIEAVGRLAGGVAHDFNNLLTVINGCAEILLRQLDESRPERELVMSIKAAGDRAAGLTRQLLAFSRKQILQPTVLDLNRLVSSMTKMLPRLLGEDIIMAEETCATPLFVKVDVSQMEQVLLNLAINARDAMPRGGKLTISTGRATCSTKNCPDDSTCWNQECAVLLVSDTGVGMDEYVRSRVFEPFFTTKEPGKGTGLGLATVHGVVKQSEGAVTVESAPGKGTVFKIYLPLIENTALAAETTPDQTAAGGRETILVVEDEESLRRLITLVLRDKGYRVLTAEHGLEALQLRAEHSGRIDLVLTDVVMPFLNGADLVTRLRQRDSSLKVIFMSGFNESAVIRQGVLEQESLYLTKPFSPNELATVVRSALDARGPASPPRAAADPRLSGAAV